MIPVKEKIDYAKWNKDLKPYWDKTLPSDAWFVAKPAYMKGGKGPFVRVLKNELAKGDLYCEFISLDNELYFSDRRLYKLPFNPRYDSTYKLVDDKTDIYLLSVENFTLVEQSVGSTAYIGKPAITTKEFKDYNLLELTASDLFAIVHQVPVSNKEDLNSFILNNRQK